MDEQRIKNLAYLLDIPPYEWIDVVEATHPGSRNDKDWREVARDLEAIAVRCALLAEYIECRRGGYCGDHYDHEQAAKNVSKRHVAIRKALGYSYPKQGVLKL